jgi:hypothetical protein
MQQEKTISIWFFIGLLILVYGLLILYAGVSDLSSPAPVVMAELHIGIWLGAFLTALGILYVFLFRPGRRR